MKNIATALAKELAPQLLVAQASKDHHAERVLIQKLIKSVSKSGRQESKRDIKDRLLERVIFGVTDCWHWVGPTNGFGYGRMTSKGRLQVAHRLSYEAFIGPIPDGLYALHKCDNPSCINPDHLWLGTYSDNLKDAWDKGRNKGRTGKGKKGNKK